MELAKRRALGRGLGALIPSNYQEERPHPPCIPLAAIQPNPLQPRQTFDDRAIGELAESIGRLLGDTALRDRMGRAGRRRALEVFTIPAMTDAVEAVYRELLG